MQSFTLNDITKRVEFEFVLEGVKHTLYYAEPSHKKSKEFRKARRRLENYEQRIKNGEVLKDQELTVIDELDDTVSSFGLLAFSDNENGKIATQIVDALGTNALISLMGKLDDRIDEAITKKESDSATQTPNN